MQRVAIIGRGGAGKSTLARQLGECTGLPIIHLDSEHWLPGWIAPERDAWLARVAELLREERWIMDGNFGDETMRMRLESADTVIFLDFPGWLCVWRALNRVRKWHGRTRPDLPEGCAERLDLGFLRWVYTYGGRRDEVLALVAGARREGKQTFVLRGPKDVRWFLERVAPKERG